MTEKVLAPLPKLRFVDADGNALVGGQVFVYQAGTTTKATTWTDESGLTANPNPIILDARGECNIWWDEALPQPIQPLPPGPAGSQGPEGPPGPQGSPGVPGVSTEPYIQVDLGVNDIMNLNGTPFQLLPPLDYSYYYVIDKVVWQSTIIGNLWTYSGGLFVFYGLDSSGLAVLNTPFPAATDNILTQSVNSVDVSLSKTQAGSGFGTPTYQDMTQVAGQGVVLQAVDQWQSDASPGAISKLTDIATAGTDYVIGDTVLITGAGDGNAVVEVDAVDEGGGVLVCHIVDGGTGYLTGAVVATTAQTGIGTGLQLSYIVINGNNSHLRVTVFYHPVKIYPAPGSIVTVVAAAGSLGTGYGTAETITVQDGDNNATIRPLTVTGGGAVLTFALTYAGSGYSVTTDIPTTSTGGGTGFAVDIIQVTP